MNLTGFNLFKYRLIKRLIYSMASVSQAILVILGKLRPVIPFIIRDDPPSVYYNFRVRPDKVDALEKYLDLPPGFSLAKLRFLEHHEESTYCMTVNAYNVSGGVSACRVEISAYIETPEGNKRFRCVEARSSKRSMEPVGSLVPSTCVKYSKNEDVITTDTKTKDGLNFKASFTMPPEEDAQVAYASSEWVSSNDEIYWRTGVYDRCFYNRRFAFGKTYSIPPESVSVENSTQWSTFLEPVPEFVVIYADKIEFFIVPWWNL